MKKYHYFVSYYAHDKNGDESKCNCECVANSKIETMDNIRTMERGLEEKEKFTKVIINNFRLLRVEA